MRRRSSSSRRRRSSSSGRLTATFPQLPAGLVGLSDLVSPAAPRRAAAQPHFPEDSLSSPPRQVRTPTTVSFSAEPDAQQLPRAGGSDLLSHPSAGGGGGGGSDAEALSVMIAQQAAQHGRRGRRSVAGRSPRRRRSHSSHGSGDDEVSDPGGGGFELPFTDHLSEGLEPGEWLRIKTLHAEFELFRMRHRLRNPLTVRSGVKKGDPYQTVGAIADCLTALVRSKQWVLHRIRRSLRAANRAKRWMKFILERKARRIAAVVDHWESCEEQRRQELKDKMGVLSQAPGAAGAAMDPRHARNLKHGLAHEYATWCAVDRGLKIQAAKVVYHRHREAVKGRVAQWIRAEGERQRALLRQYQDYRDLVMHGTRAQKEVSESRMRTLWAELTLLQVEQPRLVFDERTVAVAELEQAARELMQQQSDLALGRRRSTSLPAESFERGALVRHGDLGDGEVVSALTDDDGVLRVQVRFRSGALESLAGQPLRRLQLLQRPGPEPPLQRRPSELSRRGSELSRLELTRRGSSAQGDAQRRGSAQGLSLSLTPGQQPLAGPAATLRRRRSSIALQQSPGGDTPQQQPLQDCLVQAMQARSAEQPRRRGSASEGGRPRGSITDLSSDWFEQRRQSLSRRESAEHRPSERRGSFGQAGMPARQPSLRSHGDGQGLPERQLSATARRGSVSWDGRAARRLSAGPLRPVRHPAHAEGRHSASAEARHSVSDINISVHDAALGAPTGSQESTPAREEAPALGRPGLPRRGSLSEAQRMPTLTRFGLQQGAAAPPAAVQAPRQHGRAPASGAPAPAGRRGLRPMGALANPL